MIREELMQQILNGEAPAQTLSEESIETLYALAFSYYESGHYEKAMHFFRYLTVADVNSKKEWMGLAASYFMLKEPERALQCYAQAALLDENDPYPHWHAAECFEQIGEISRQKEALKTTKEQAMKQQEKYSSLLEKIELLEQLEKERISLCH